MIGFTTANRFRQGAEGRTAADSGNSGTCDQPGFLAAAEAEQGGYFKFMTAAERTRGQAGELVASLSRYLEDQDFETVTNLWETINRNQ